MLKQVDGVILRENQSANYVPVMGDKVHETAQLTTDGH